MYIFIDIGSTQIKVAHYTTQATPSLLYYTRDYCVQVADQVEQIIQHVLSKHPEATFRICSSANGGLQVGICALTPIYSGNIARNLASSAGANILYEDTLDTALEQNHPPVDVLIVAGGIDLPKAPFLSKKIASLDLSFRPHKHLIYAGNQYYAAIFKKKYPDAEIIPNLTPNSLHSNDECLIHTLRMRYLDDLRAQDGIDRLQTYSDVSIWPTPAIVGEAFKRIHQNTSSFLCALPALVLDIGGATTDIHFDLSIRQRSDHDASLQLLNRYVFSELGVFSSRTSTLSRLTAHSRLFEFFQALYGDDATLKYASFVENEFEESLLFYAIFFLVLDALTCPEHAKTPTLNVSQVNSLIITGGASQVVVPEKLTPIMKVACANTSSHNLPHIYLDTAYALWIEGMKYFPNAELE